MKMKLLSLLLLVAFGTSTATAQLTIAQRKDSIRAFFTHEDVGEHFASVTALTLREETRDEGITAFDRFTQGTSPEIMERFRLTASWLHLRPFLPDSLTERVQFIWAEFPVRPFFSEYEKVAYYTALYLAAPRFPEDAIFFNGRSREENTGDAYAFLLHWIRESTEQGQREFDSPTYGVVFFTAMLLLRDFAPDADMRTRAALMAQWLLADFAHDHLNGNYVGAHARENLFSAMQPISSEMSSISWLYFGDGPRLFSREQFFAALSDFEPHPAIVELATRRSEPYESWERKRPAVRIRDNGLAETADSVIRYTYMDPLYAIGSIPGGLIQPLEQHSWDVTWINDDPERPSTLFFMQPYADPNALTPFLPHGEDRTFRNVSSLDPYWGTLTKTVGGSPYEDVFQYKNTLIALYDIGGVSRFPVLAGFLPLKADSMHVDSLETGWITIHAGDVYLAVYPFGAYRLADGMFGKRFVSGEKRNGVVVHVTGRDDVGSFSSFIRGVHATAVDLSSFAEDRTVRYTTPDGDRLEFRYRGIRSVNGRTPRIPDGMLFSSPRLSGKRGSGILTIHAAAGDVEIDMNTLEIRSLP